MLPACMSLSATVPVLMSSWSARVLLPWSMWAMIEKLRIFAVGTWKAAHRCQLHALPCQERQGLPAGKKALFSAPHLDYAAVCEFRLCLFWDFPNYALSAGSIAAPSSIACPAARLVGFGRLLHSSCSHYCMSFWAHEPLPFVAVPKNVGVVASKCG